MSQTVEAATPQPNPGSLPDDQPQVALPDDTDVTDDSLTDDTDEDDDADPEVASTGTWIADEEDEEDDNVTHDNNFGEGDEEAWADDEYWDEDAAADAWLARNLGGGRLLYPHLFIIQPRNGSKDVITPRRDVQKPCQLLDLPREIRDLVYSHFFDHAETDPWRLTEDYAPFPVHNGRRVPRVHLSSEDVELKFWLSSGLLQISRQIRFEALPIFLGARVFTTDHLKVIPRFADFLGSAGCAMVRFLDLWDHDDMQSWQHPRHARERPFESLQYQSVITSLHKFPRLQHLRLVFCRSAMSDLLRRNPWYTLAELDHYRHPKGAVKAGVKPKILTANLGEWPEFELLERISAKECTLAFDEAGDNSLIDFDHTTGALPDLINTMHANYDRQRKQDQGSANASLNDSDHSLPGIHAIPMWSNASNNTSTPWLDTDDLEDKTVPLYNYLRSSISRYTAAAAVDDDDDEEEEDAPAYQCFPYAETSVGAIVRTCPSCYILHQHCGYHGLPDQHSTEEDVTRYQRLSYADLSSAADDLINDVHRSEELEFFARYLILQRYFGWPEQPAFGRLQSLDAAVGSGWQGRNIDKQEVKVWDVLFYKVYLKFLIDGTEWINY
jgi:hypothetical protein